MVYRNNVYRRSKGIKVWSVHQRRAVDGRVGVLIGTNIGSHVISNQEQDIGLAIHLAIVNISNGLTII